MLTAEVQHMREEVLVFLIRKREILLGVKRRKTGAGKRNGPGGKIEAGDRSRRWRAAREVLEEFGLAVPEEHLKKAAEIVFSNPLLDGESRELTKVHVYLGEACGGTPVATREMGDPQWFRFRNIPYKDMMAADKLFLPRILKGEQLWGYVRYGTDGRVESSEWFLSRYDGGEQ